MTCWNEKVHLSLYLVPNIVFRIGNIRVLLAKLYWMLQFILVIMLSNSELYKRKLIIHLLSIKSVTINEKNEPWTWISQDVDSRPNFPLSNVTVTKLLLLSKRKFLQFWNEGNELDQGLANHRPQAISSPPPTFVNKVLLKHSHVHSFKHDIRLLLYCNGKVE